MFINSDIQEVLSTIFLENFQDIFLELAKKITYL